MVKHSNNSPATANKLFNKQIIQKYVMELFVVILFMLLASFYTPWKYQKTKGSDVFKGYIDQWWEIVLIYNE